MEDIASPAFESHSQRNRTPVFSAGYSGSLHPLLAAFGLYQVSLIGATGVFGCLFTRSRQPAVRVDCLRRGLFGRYLASSGLPPRVSLLIQPRRPLLARADYAC